MGKNELLKFSGLLILMIPVSLFITPQADAQHSLYRDVKANQVGDIITVILRENISGSSTSDSRSSANSDGNASGSVSGNFLPFEPTFGSDVTVNYGSDEMNLASQKQLLEGYMSVQIVEVTPSGDLLVEGERVTEINGERHEMSLSGTIRQRDVDSRNQVLSFKVANANISYQKEEGLKKMTKRRGLIKRIVFAGIGVALGSVIVARELQ